MLEPPFWGDWAQGAGRAPAGAEQDGNTSRKGPAEPRSASVSTQGWPCGGRGPETSTRTSRGAEGPHRGTGKHGRLLLHVPVCKRSKPSGHRPCVLSLFCPASHRAVTIPVVPVFSHLAQPGSSSLTAPQVTALAPRAAAATGDPHPQQLGGIGHRATERMDVSPPFSPFYFHATG